MKQFIIWKTAFSSIFKNKRRSLLTILGIVIGIAAVITIVSIGNGFKVDMVNTLSLNNKKEIGKKIDLTPYNASDMFNDQDLFFDRDLNAVDKLEMVETVDYKRPSEDEQKVISGTLTFKTPMNKELSINYGLVEKTAEDLLLGRQLTEADNIRKEKVVIVDEVVAQELYSTADNALNQPFKYKNQLFTIVGIIRNTAGPIAAGQNTKFLYFPKQSYIRYFGELKNTSTIVVTFISGYDSEKGIEEVVKFLNAQGTMRNIGVYEESKDEAEIASMESLLNNLTLFISVVAAISLIIAGIGVMNMMYISVSERTKEIAIRRALGGTANDIKYQFLSEGITLTVFGGIVGYLLGTFLAYLASIILPFSVHPDLMTALLAIGISTVIGLIFSYFPAASAAKKDLIDIIK